MLMPCLPCLWSLPLLARNICDLAREVILGHPVLQPLDVATSFPLTRMDMKNFVDQQHTIFKRVLLDTISQTSINVNKFRDYERFEFFSEILLNS